MSNAPQQPAKVRIHWSLDDAGIIIFLIAVGSFIGQIIPAMLKWFFMYMFAMN